MGEPFHLSSSTKAALLTTAHRAVARAVGNASGERDKSRAEVPTPGDVAGVFVSVHVGSELRGCLGTFAVEASLDETVGRMAAAAATHDTRFHALEADELPALAVEISLLGPPRPAWAGEPWRLGEQGLAISRDEARGVLLPQVARTHGLDRRGFLEATCAKAGLPRDAWRDRRTRVMAFDAEVFGDHSPLSSHRA